MMNTKISNLLLYPGSSLLLVNSSDSSDCEDHEAGILAGVRAGALHPHHQDLLQHHQLSRAAAADHQLAAAAAAAGSAGGQHDPFSRAPAPPGSSVVDELLKPLQSYFSVFRTGQYTGGMDADLVNGGPPAHNTRSHAADKRYRIRKQQENERNKKRGERSEITENGHLAHGHHPGLGMVPMGAPPPITNGFGPHHPMEADMSHLPPPNMAEPPPNMAHYPPPPHLQHPLLLPPPVLLSSSPVSPSAPLYAGDRGQVPPPGPAPGDTAAEPGQDQTTSLDLDISKMSISDPPPAAAEADAETQQLLAEAEADEAAEPQPVDVEQLAELLTKDLFNLYSLSFVCKSKDLSERRVRLDFGLSAEVSRAPCPRPSLTCRHCRCPASAASWAEWTRPSSSASTPRRSASSVCRTRASPPR